MPPTEAMTAPGGPPLVLASGSAVRTRLLAAAGVAHEIVPTDVDEGAVRDRLLAEDASHREIAEALAECKARFVAPARPGAIVLGADQVLSCGGELFEKPAGLEGVRDHLHRLGDRDHMLHAAVCAVRDGAVVWRHVGDARLRMRTLSDAFIENYVDAVGVDACGSVGAYLMEGLGVHLFSEIDGDFFDILGLPLLPALGFLREAGVVRS